MIYIYIYVYTYNPYVAGDMPPIYLGDQMATTDVRASRCEPVPVPPRLESWWVWDPMFGGKTYGFV